jgi:uncharacterized ferritin-like protein (DUF455 family)
MVNVLVKQLEKIDTTEVPPRRVSTDTSILIEPAKLFPRMRISIAGHQLLLHAGEAITFRAVYLGADA